MSELYNVTRQREIEPPWEYISLGMLSFTFFLTSFRLQNERSMQKQQKLLRSFLLREIYDVDGRGLFLGAYCTLQAS